MIELYTDGSSLTNPGKGGWATIIIENGQRTVLQGSDTLTTNNRMELQAVISGLSHNKDPSEITVYCDSAYIVNCFIQKWYVKWRKNGWMSSMGKPVENQDLWTKLLAQYEKHKVTWQKVKGHADNVIHNECDVLARDAAKQQIQGGNDGHQDCHKPGNAESGVVGTPTSPTTSSN
jgi:ribonuclease HI